MADQPQVDRVHTAEVVASLCLATDLGMGFPFEHGLEATLITMRLADILDVDSDTAAQCFYASLLMYAGCTTDAHLSAHIFAGGLTANLTPVEFGSSSEKMAAVLKAVTPPDLPWSRRIPAQMRRLPMAARYRKPHYTALCEVAEMLADRLGLPPSISGLFRHVTERWDGDGVLGRARGEDVPLPIRIVHVARDAANQRLLNDPADVVEVIRSRAGKAFDPAIAEQFAEASGDILSGVDQPAWDGVLAAEPKPRLELSGEAIDRALGAMGDFSDLASPYLSGHASGVAQVAARTAQVCGFSPSEVTQVRRAGLIHDVGRVGVHPRIWSQEGALSVDQWEQVRLHPYHTERILDRSPLLAEVSAVACCHHERCDGSGYHRRLDTSSLSRASRLLAAADAFHAMTEPRAHRPRRSPEEAATVMTSEARAGLHDPDMVAAILEASGLPAATVTRAAGLTEREAEVIGLVARGLQTKQVARELDISPKTADNHIQNAYRKMGVSTRAAATLFAMENGLVD